MNFWHHQPGVTPRHREPALTIMKETDMAELSAERRHLLQAIKTSEKPWTLASLSRALGRNAAYLQQYIHRQSPKRLPEADRHILSQLLSVPQSQLRPESDVLYDSERHDEHIAIPFFDIESSAGQASIIDEIREEQATSWHFAKPLLSHIPHDGRDKLRLIKVRGDSMSPLLDDGDIIMIDASKTDPSQKGIYVLDDGHGLVVKRLEVLEADENQSAPRLRIVSDNPHYVPYRRALTDIRIVGRVVWMSRTVL